MIRAASATHKGNRYGVDRWRSAANMYLTETNKTSCFFAGDTALASEAALLRLPFSRTDHPPPRGGRDTHLRISLLRI